MINLLFY